MMPARRDWNWLQCIFNEFSSEWLERTNASTPAVNILEHKEGYRVEIAVPGMDKKDLKVNIEENNKLVISAENCIGEKDESKRGGTYLRREFFYGQFRQSLLLPDNVEKERIAAKVEHGLLTINIPKKTVTDLHKIHSIDVR